MNTFTTIKSSATRGATVKSTQTTTQPLAPVIFKATTDGNGKLSVSIVVLIDTNFMGTPKLAKDEKGTSFYVQYNNKEEVPESLTYWLVTATFTSKCIVGDDVMAYNQDTDPKTSRGTMTGVGHG